MTTSLARFSVRRPVIVLVIWLAVVAAGFTFGIGVFERLVGDVGVVAGSESTRAADRREALEPEPEEITAIISGVDATDPTVTAAVDRVSAQLRSMPGVAEVSPPLPAPDTGRAVLFTVTMDFADDADDVAAQAAERIRADTDVPGGTLTVTGGSLSEDEFSEQAASDVARAELFSTPVMLLLLLIVFGGLLAAGLPLLIAVVGVGGTFGVLFAFSQVTDVSVYSIQIVTMLAVGLAVDYALLVVYRFREERAVDPEVGAAVLRTAGTAGRTVLFSGLTVAVALAGLTVFPDPFLRSMGIAGTAVVVRRPAGRADPVASPARAVRQADQAAGPAPGRRRGVRPAGPDRAAPARHHRAHRAGRDAVPRDPGARPAAVRWGRPPAAGKHADPRPLRRAGHALSR